MLLRPLLIAGCLLVLLGSAASAHALPKNFRNVDIFYVGGMPDEEDIEELSMLGIEHIVSLHRMPKKVRQRAVELGLVVHNYPLRTTLKHTEEITRLLDENPPSTVFIHCQHGADRTGAVTAYWLYIRRGYDPIGALASVVSPKKYHIKGVRSLAQEYAFSLDLEYPVLGRFSGAHNGGLEGLKVRGRRWYTRLARSYLMNTLGDPLNEPSTSFWTEEEMLSLEK